MIANIVAAFPQSPRKFSSVLVTEVDNVDPETKRAFGNGARSVLYSSLPEFSLDLSNFEVRTKVVRTLIIIFPQLPLC